MPLQQGPRFDIPLESTCWFHEFHKRELYDGSVLPVEREL